VFSAAHKLRGRVVPTVADDADADTAAMP